MTLPAIPPGADRDLTLQVRAPRPIGGTRTRSQGWPQATRQGLALTAARTPPHFGMPERHLRITQGLTAGVCSIRCPSASVLGSRSVPVVAS
jgi:hypothetical protein